MSDEYPTKGAVTVEVAASPAEVFAFLTDLDRLPTISPENERCEFLEGHDAIAIGARFRGHNRAGDYTWHADCEVTVADPGRTFEFAVPPDFEHLTTWRYDIEETDGGCRVTESFDAPLLALPDIYPGRIEGRCAQLEAACRTSLENLKAALESTSDPENR